MERTPQCPPIPLCAAPPACSSCPSCLQLYSHHVLAQLAADAEEAAGAGAKRARTLPSFWAAKAALERQQRQLEERRQVQAQPRKQQQQQQQEGGEEGDGEGQPAREAKRPRLTEGQRQGDGKEGEGEEQGAEVEEEEDEEALSDFRCVALCPAAAAAGGLAPCLRGFLFSSVLPASQPLLLLLLLPPPCQPPANIPSQPLPLPSPLLRRLPLPLPAVAWTARLRRLLSWQQMRAASCRRAAGRRTSAYTASLTG